MSGLEAKLAERPKPAAAEVYEIDPLQDPRWVEFVRTHPDASVFHTRNWLSALRAEYGYLPSVFCTSRGGARITDAVVFCRIHSWLTGKRIVSLPFSDHCEPLVSSPECLDPILQRLRAELQAKGLKYLELRPINQGVGPNRGFRESSTYVWHSIDLSRTGKALFQSFDKDCVQRRIRRAERESLDYEVGNSEELLKRFFTLFVTTRRRHYLPPQPYSWFRHLSRAFGNQLQIRLISYKGRPISTTLTLAHAQTVAYKYGGSDARFNYLGATPLLFWRTIQEAQSQGFTRMDLGRSNLDSAGLIKFKENWGAQRRTLQYFQAGALTGFELGPAARFLRRLVCPVAPQWSLIALGNMLYRHLG